jgi:hypothetical protein
MGNRDVSRVRLRHRTVELQPLVTTVSLVRDIMAPERVHESVSPAADSEEAHEHELQAHVREAYVSRRIADCQLISTVVRPLSFKSLRMHFASNTYMTICTLRCPGFYIGRSFHRGSHLANVRDGQNKHDCFAPR